MTEHPHWMVVRNTPAGITVRHSESRSTVRLDHETGTVSDTYHTIGELYEHRSLLTAALFRMLDRQWHVYDVHKARLHSDGTGIDGFFIVMATLPTGQISYHYPETDWELFDIPERVFASPWDGHSSADVLDRLRCYLRGE